MEESMVGHIGEVEMEVEERHTARNIGSGDVEVFATPMLVALMEMAAIEALKEVPHLLTVGTMVDMKHLGATPVGMRVRAKAELVEVEHPRLLFHIEAFDESEKIGEGRHQRFVIDRDRFMARVKEKLSYLKEE